MTFWVGFLIYVVGLGIYWFFVWSIYWHISEYTLPNDASKWFVSVFLTTAVSLSILSFGLFFTLPLQ